MSPVSLTLRFRLEEADQARAARFLVLHDRRMRLGLATTAAFVLAVPFLFLREPASILLGMGAGLVLFVAFVASLVMGAGRAARAGLRALPAKRREREYGFMEGEILVRDGGQLFPLPWSEVAGAYETREAFFVRTRAEEIHVIPKRAAQRGAEVEAVRGWLREKVPRARMRG